MRKKLLQKLKKPRKLFNKINLTRSGEALTSPFFIFMNEETNTDYKNAYNYCIRLLSHRDYSRYKVEEKLQARKHLPETIDKVISELIELNYLREEEYKRIRVNQLLAKMYSVHHIVQKCQQEHLDVGSSFVEEIMSEKGIDKFETIDYLIEKKLRSANINQDYSKLKAKVYRFILSKGYSPSDALARVNHKVSEFYNNEEI